MLNDSPNRPVINVLPLGLEALDRRNGPNHQPPEVAERPLQLVRPGRMDYDAAYQLQRQLLRRVQAEPDSLAYLILLEHPPTITLGRTADPAHVILPEPEIRRRGGVIRETNRGGDVTYHGPGQLVGYPIIALRGRRRSVHGYLRSLESALIHALAPFGIEAGRRPEYTGVWVGAEKIAAIGVAFSRWVTFHGFALNISPDLSHFRWILPCGIRDYGVTSMEKLLGYEPDFEAVTSAVIEQFCREFGFVAKGVAPAAL